MSNPYTTVAISGYNADAPPDDGTTGSDNQVNWAKHKDKLGDPLKNLAESINSNVLTAFGKIFGQGINSQSGNYSVLTTDQGHFIPFTATATATLPAVATAGDGFAVAIINTGSGVVTVDGASSETINGATSIYLGPGEAAILTCDSSSWSAAISRRLFNRAQSKSTSYVLLVTDDGSLVEFTAAGTLTLLAAATAGSEYRLLVYNSGTGLVTLDGASSETINGATTLTLMPNQWAILSCDGSAWTALVTQDVSTQLKMKPADEPVNNSTTLQDDDDLANYKLEADEYYRIFGFLHVTGQVAADLKIALTFSNAPQKFLLHTPSGVATSSGSAISFTFGATTVYVVINGYIRANAAAGGTVKLQWAQDTADASDTKILEGSWIEIEKRTQP